MKTILVLIITFGLFFISQEISARNVGICEDPDIISNQEVDESMATWDSWPDLRGDIASEGRTASVYHFNAPVDMRGMANRFVCENKQDVVGERDRKINIAPVWSEYDFRNNQILSLCNTFGLCTNRYERFRATMSSHALGLPPEPFEVSPLQVICAVDRRNLTPQMPWANINIKRLPIEGTTSSLSGGPIVKILEGRIVRVYHNLDIGAGGPDADYNYCAADVYEEEDTIDNGSNGMRLFRFVVDHPCRPTESCSAEATRAVQICHEFATAMVNENPIYVDGTPIDICGRVKTRSVILLRD